jgi:hypothetical protein
MRAKEGSICDSRAKEKAKGFSPAGVTCLPGFPLRETGKGFESPWGYSKPTCDQSQVGFLIALTGFHILAHYLLNHPA